LWIFTEITATYAISATSAIYAITAISATSATSAIYAITAISATSAITAITAITATSAICKCFRIVNRVILIIKIAIPFVFIIVYPKIIFFDHIIFPSLIKVAPVARGD